MSESISPSPVSAPSAVRQREAARRAGLRADRVAGGLAELDEWLTDQVRGGIAGLERAGYRQIDQVAARLVDAQAPGVAGAVRGLATIIASGEGWPARLLAELSLLRLLTRSYRRLDTLPPELAATVRARIGFPVSTSDVLAGARRRDRWQVIGVRDELGEQLVTRRTWLVGATTGQSALVLSFTPVGTSGRPEPPADLIAGTATDMDLCFYPGAALRALVAQRYGPPEPLREPQPVTDVAGALRAYARGLSANPWLSNVAVVLRGTLVTGRPWRLVDAAGEALPLVAAHEPWPLLAAGGGGPICVAAEWGPAGLRMLAGYREYEVIAP